MDRPAAKKHKFNQELQRIRTAGYNRIDLADRLETTIQELTRRNEQQADELTQLRKELKITDERLENYNK